MLGAGGGKLTTSWDLQLHPLWKTSFRKSSEKKYGHVCRLDVLRAMHVDPRPQCSTA